MGRTRPPWASLLHVLEARAEQQPDRLAGRFLRDGTSDDAVDWTYGDLAVRSAGVAAELRDLGLEGRPVVLAVDPGLPYLATLLAIFQVGAIAVPSFPPTGKRAAARFVSIHGDCSPALIIADPRYRRIRDDLAPGAEWLFVDDDFCEERATGEHPLLRPSTSDVGALPALIQYTSGSTGEPKGVVLNHDNLVSNCAVLERNMGPDPERLGVSWLPPYHDMGLMGYLMFALYDCSPFVQMSPVHFVQQPYRWLKAISDYQATITATPPFALDLCTATVTDDELATLDLGSLREIFCGAEPVVRATLDRFRDRFAPCGYRESALIPCYGLAEATLFVSGKPAGTTFTSSWIDRATLERGEAKAAEAGDSGAVEIVSCGAVADGHQVLIVDPETRRPLADGRVGEVWVSGPNVAEGYHGRPEVTAETFHARLAGGDTDGAGRTFLRTGDLGFLRDGELHITGRIKDLVIIAGRNLYPQDIELSARQASILVGNVAAFAVAEDGQAEELVVVAELIRGFTPRAAEVDEVREAIVAAVTADHGVTPVDVYVGPGGTVRTTNSGKVQRSATCDAYRKGELKRLRLSEPDDQTALAAP